MNMNDKITRQHLDRDAYVYIRQSTGHQVRHHHQGRERQYDLGEQARQFGFQRVVIVDDDQGKTGSGMVDRPGFATLLSAVCASQVGAVFALEASRLARNNRDWHHLIDLCALTETLIIDGDGIYDPRQINDRLLLGLKGTMSEFELNLFRQRARQAYEMKIAKGHALWEVPVGYVRDEQDRVEKIADRQVQSAIESVFRKFRELGSARQTMLWFRDHQLPLPSVIRGTGSKQIVWRLPTRTRIGKILTNPCYAGALAYGRTETKTTIRNGRAHKSQSRNDKPPQQWKVLILDNHESYITWEDYLENQTMLKSNAASREPNANGVTKKGLALLSGLLRCGHCGRKMFVGYTGNKRNGRFPIRYMCHGGREARGSAACQSFGGASIDRAVGAAVLEAIQPAGIEAAMQAIDEFERDSDQRRHQLELAQEKSHYEVDRARRQYDEVDPANRLVASELEARWNAALKREAELTQQLDELNQQRSELTDQERLRLLELGRDLPSLWRCESTTPEMKKRILRTVLQEITVRDNESRTTHLLALHWKGGIHTELEVPRNGPGKKVNDTSKTALELIEELSKVCSDQTIAATLNRLGYKTGGGKTWRVHSVYNARYIHRLTNHRKADEAWVTVEQAAIQLGVSHTVIRRLIREETLPANQVVPTTPWIIGKEDLERPAVKEAIEAVKAGRQLRSNDSKQSTFSFE